MVKHTLKYHILAGVVKGFEELPSLKTGLKVVDTHVSLEEFDSLRSSSAPPVVVDIRREVDYQADAATIPGALRGDPDALDEWAASLPRDREIVVYCVRGGSVSQSVTPKLQDRGLKVRYLTGGIEAWKRSGGKTNQAS